MERHHRRLFHGILQHLRRQWIDYPRFLSSWALANSSGQGGSLAVRGGARAMRNGAIGCAILLAVIEGVGIGFQRMMAENTTKLEPPPPMPQPSSTSQAALA